MLGETIDYLILRSLSHSRNIATEEDLNDRARSESSFSIDEAEFRLRKLLRRFEGHFPINEEFRYLDIGCGTGDITIALARAGAKYVTGIDIMPRNIVTAEVYAKQMQVQNTVRFICDDIHSWKPPARYDVLISHEELEQIEDPRIIIDDQYSCLIRHLFHLNDITRLRSFSENFKCKNRATLVTPPLPRPVGLHTS